MAAQGRRARRLRSAAGARPDQRLSRPPHRRDRGFVLHQHPSAAGLAGIPLFAGLTDDARAVLADRFEVSEFDVGRRLVAEGRAGFSFYVVVSGRVSVEKQGRPVRSLGPGDFFGEIAILGGAGRRTATVTGTEPGVAWTLLADHFRALQAERPDVADALRAAMQERLAADER